VPRRVPFFVVDAFTDAPFDGNPAGVFLDAETLTPDEMRRLCAEVSLESAFVFTGDDDSDLALRFFTGATEIALCGHATVSALVALAAFGRVAAGPLRVRTSVGVLSATVSSRPDGGGFDVTLWQRPPVFGPPLTDIAPFAEALGCGPERITATGLPVRVVSTGSPFLFVPVDDEEAVRNAPGSLAEIARLSREHDAYGVYAFAQTAGGGTGGRCFAPAAGLDEDPVTGSASGALGAYLVEHAARTPGTDGFVRFVARQGLTAPAGRGGSVAVEIGTNAGKVVSVAVSGSALVVAEGAFTLP
jgi:PhzF family phenazine biosynthesis protein